MHFYALFDLVLEDIRPGTNIEWLILANIAGLFWEIGRYRGWKEATLRIYRRSAPALRDTKLAGVTSSATCR